MFSSQVGPRLKKPAEALRLTDVQESKLRLMRLLISQSAYQTPHKAGVMVHACNPIIWKIDIGKAEAQGHSCLHSKFKANLDYMRPLREEEIVRD